MKILKTARDIALLMSAILTTAFVHIAFGRAIIRAEERSET
jgi:hypothetical protein